MALKQGQPVMCQLYVDSRENRLFSGKRHRAKPMATSRRSHGIKYNDIKSPITRIETKALRRSPKRVKKQFGLVG